MTDIIRLLPDSVANQIAAGEVIQRPASVVKELIENSIDAGADNIKLIIKDGGRTLIQVMDNGSGMSETDARMSFERHATSKIKQVNDLFSIYTMGFRGEALASICAIAHVELKTKTDNDELGTLIINEGSIIKCQEPCTCNKGTSIAVKNLFYNVPARRNFLKSEQIELKHITDEFLRLALANAHIAFSFYHNNSEVYILEKNNLKKRIIQCYSNSYNEKLIPVELITDTVSFSGFISKAEYAKKTRGEQFFFTNKRFMKHNYLNHAVLSAYNNLISKDAFPSYFIFIDINPELIDINIHPTKTEIKFQDEKIIYSFLNASIKKSLGVHNVMPSIDFSKDPIYDVPPLPKDKFVEPPVIKINPDFNPFEKSKNFPNNQESALDKNNKKNWKKLYEEFIPSENDINPTIDISPDYKTNTQNISPNWNNPENINTSEKIIQIQNSYILTTIKSGIMIIDQQSAHERILYEKFLFMLENKKNVSQQLLFPLPIELSPSDAELANELSGEFATLGFDFKIENKTHIVVYGTPADIDNINLQQVFENMLENFKNNLISLKLNKAENIAASLSKNLAIKKGKQLEYDELKDLIDKLFSCKSPYLTPYGKATVSIIKMEDIEKYFI